MTAQMNAPLGAPQDAVQTDLPDLSTFTFSELRDRTGEDMDRALEVITAQADRAPAVFRGGGEPGGGPAARFD
ncbi:hypothetical protein [Streptomyces purpurascens]|uniref:FXSXX-COOH protein n=1 Tax=Streptomyces purpurascens TaxID=1924 RepID=A0ABZ1MKS0_STREF|nr:hypothetical protein [Streptomyces purpurascens]MCE7051107.1 hypothetical protein [Streptomyces purpurascens]GHA53317.1 hypothetical protein GCM10010303_76650 [Streptomyces purpurascens]